MTKLLGEAEIVALIQESFPKDSTKFAVAYFSRKRSYSYYVYDSIDDLVAFLCDKDIDDVWLQDPKTITFLSDEWFIFATEEKAIEVFDFIKKGLHDSGE